MLLQYQNDSSSAGVYIILSLILRIAGAIVCYNKAEKLNRSKGGWGRFGIFFPLIAIIAIYCMKPYIKWEKTSNSPE